MESRVDESTERSTEGKKEEKEDNDDGAGTEEQVATTEASAKDEDGDRVAEVGLRIWVA